MIKKKQTVYPYIPNSVSTVKNQMLKEVGAKRVEDFFEDIPKKLRLKKNMNLPKPLLSEYSLRKHIEGILSKNKTCQEHLNFLGAGCWQHCTWPATHRRSSPAQRWWWTAADWQDQNEER